MATITAVPSPSPAYSPSPLFARPAGWGFEPRGASILLADGSSAGCNPSDGNESGRIGELPNPASPPGPPEDPDTRRQDPDVSGSGPEPTVVTRIVETLRRLAADLTPAAALIPAPTPA